MFCLFLVLLSYCFVGAESFFLIAGKNEPIFFCFKICPLYCSPRGTDEDVPSFIYYDDESFPPNPYLADDPHPYYFNHCESSPPKPTTTKPSPTTMAPLTTEEPSWICMVCMKKCNFPNSN